MEKEQAADIFGVSSKHVRHFDRVDPFNENVVKGWICRKRNHNGGSLVIDNVNGKETNQVIWATPKLQYPYKNVGSTELKSFKDKRIVYVYFSEKWNGMNILFYKYIDDTNKEVITAKSKGTPFVSNSEVGNFLSLLKEALDQKDEEFENVFNTWKYDSAKSISFELCGKKEPHLVNYDFELKLKPLFIIYDTGNVKPIMTCSKTSYFENCINEKENSVTKTLHKLINKFQNECFEKNEKYRYENNLSIKYEYNYFITEGYVMYLLDKEGFVIDKIMYKIKPSDIEEVHWQTFDDNMENKVIEAVNKCKEREYEVNLDNIRVELDMGPKEWNKFGNRIKKFLESEKYNG